ncbi:hypothetical protein, variant [Cryptococcus amylolentus CBS 6039]|uniref:Zn(2)-C6 fungal-type domain-containing protein n=1 Tax=Cryptococcus amylolentus CBS 6039 TaxID=1295533 RepID=A0A1E3I0B8_9TREE|nr:hypothetical protein, variant [Cryptococcus amylolentus CBS 6039]ODN82030.1 hypothetical protein, variant [Cryptococcus amylolentus CBS 6039]
MKHLNSSQASRPTSSSTPETSVDLSVRTTVAPESRQSVLAADKPAKEPVRISCDSCRIRKIKCSAEKPMCMNCKKKSNACTYPTSIRRRGPDKLPGTRATKRDRREKHQLDQPLEATLSKKVEMPLPTAHPPSGSGLAQSSETISSDTSSFSMPHVLQLSHSTGGAGDDSAPRLLGSTDVKSDMAAAKPEPSPGSSRTSSVSSCQPASYRQAPSRSHPQPLPELGYPRSSGIHQLQSGLASGIPHDPSSLGTPSYQAFSHLSLEQELPAQQPPLSYPLESYPSYNYNPGPALKAPLAANNSVTSSQELFNSQHVSPIYSAPLVYPTQPTSLDTIGSDPIPIFYPGLDGGMGAATQESNPAMGQSAAYSSLTSSNISVSSSMGLPPAGMDPAIQILPAGVQGLVWQPMAESQPAVQGCDSRSMHLWPKVAHQTYTWPVGTVEPVFEHPYMAQEYGETEEQRVSRLSRKRKTSMEGIASFKMYDAPGNIGAASEGWWRWILSQYDTDRRLAISKVVKSCNAFFTDSSMWSSFLNKPMFFSSLLTNTSSDNGTPSLRAAPHILLAILSLVTLLQQGHTPEGHALALLFNREAQSILSYCVQAGSQDPSLMAAAIVIAIFETMPHKDHKDDRLGDALVMLDGIGCTVFSSRLDADDDRVTSDMLGLPRLTWDAAASVNLQKSQGKLDMDATVASWAQVPGWGENWSPGEMWKEEMRRMCWTASSIAASHSLWKFMVGKKTLDLRISRPERFRLFFPGEMVFLEAGDDKQGKTTPWALYQRLICLWHFVTNNRPLEPHYREQIVKELTVIEEDIQILVQVGGMKVYLWQSLDWAMVLRRILGAVDPKTLEKWFQVELKYFHSLLGDRALVPGVKRRPMVTWWMLIEAYSALEMSRIDKAFWDDADKIYHMALDNAQVIIDYWDCEHVLRASMDGLRERFRLIQLERQSILRAEGRIGIVRG